MPFELGTSPKGKSETVYNPISSPTVLSPNTNFAHQ